MEFFEVKRVSDVWELYEDLKTVGQEEIPLEEAYGRVLAHPVVAPLDFPPFPRSTMDGYALKAEDTFGASLSSPIPFKVVGEVEMGKAPTFVLGEGEAAYVPTGGMLPEGANGVIMVEHVRGISQGEIEVLRPIAPWENVMRPGEDFKKGELLLEKGRRLKPQDLGICATIGLKYLTVFKKPRVGIISTGDEIVPVEAEPALGQIRNSNAYMLMGFVKQEGGAPLFLGHVRDRKEELINSLKKAVELCDMVLVSGGSSVGTRDLVAKALEELGAEVLVHGVAISPGKPTLFAKVDQVPIWGLPGHPASCAIVTMVLVLPSLRKIGGEEPYLPPFRSYIKARVKRNVPSASGREDYIRVVLEKRGEEVWAEPIFSKSGALWPLVRGQGLLKVELEREGLVEGEEVTVYLL